MPQRIHAGLCLMERCCESFCLLLKNSHWTESVRRGLTPSPHICSQELSNMLEVFIPQRLCLAEALASCLLAEPGKSFCLSLHLSPRGHFLQVEILEKCSHGSQEPANTLQIHCTDPFLFLELSLMQTSEQLCSM